MCRAATEGVREASRGRLGSEYLGQGLSGTELVSRGGFEWVMEATG